MEERIKQRIKGALVGMFVGDALGVPVHWMYNRDNIVRDFGAVEGYVQLKPVHPESMLSGMAYRPEAPGFDILHGRAKHYLGDMSAGGRGSFTDEHGNTLSVPPAARLHYHYGLDAGDHTVNMWLPRLLFRDVAARDGYSAVGYLEAFRDFMLTPDSHRDTYLEVFVRRFFEEHSRGVPLPECACDQRRVWSIGSTTGINVGVPMAAAKAMELLPAVLREHALPEGDGEPSAGLRGALDAVAAAATEAATAHSRLTHVSINVEEALAVVVPLLVDMFAGLPARSSILRACARTRLPVISGDELLAKYRRNNGPGNIPDDEMYALHRDFKPGFLDPEPWLAEEDNTVVGSLLSHACYTEHGLPSALYLAYKYVRPASEATDCGFRAALVADTNAGGDCTSRNCVVGCILGAAAGFDALPGDLREGLLGGPAIFDEVDAFLARAAAPLV